MDELTGTIKMVSGLVCITSLQSGMNHISGVQNTERFSCYGVN